MTPRNLPRPNTESPTHRLSPPRLSGNQRIRGNLAVEVQAELSVNRVRVRLPEEPGDSNTKGESRSTMKVFLSWSGETSGAFASILHEWLPSVLHYVDPWMSSEDITKGRRWDPEMASALEKTSYGLVCVTPGVHREPWVNFEAGAVSKIVSKSYLSPLLLGVSIEELAGLPLSMFQCTQFKKVEMLKLLRSINGAAGSRVPPRRLKSSLDYSWGELRQRVDGIDLTSTEDPGKDDQEHEDHEAESDSLSDREEQILVLVATRGRNEPRAADIAAHLDEQILVAQYHIDRLVKEGFLSEGLFFGPELDSTYRITRKGRAYVVENRLV